MKKWISIIMAVSLALTIVGCRKTDAANNEANDFGPTEKSFTFSDVEKTEYKKNRFRLLQMNRRCLEKMFWNWNRIADFNFC